MQHLIIKKKPGPRISSPFLPQEKDTMAMQLYLKVHSDTRHIVHLTPDPSSFKTSRPEPLFPFLFCCRSCTLWPCSYASICSRRWTRLRCCRHRTPSSAFMPWQPVMTCTAPCWMSGMCRVCVCVSYVGRICETCACQEPAHSGVKLALMHRATRHALCC